MRMMLTICHVPRHKTGPETSQSFKEVGRRFAVFSTLFIHTFIVQGTHASSISSGVRTATELGTSV